MADIEQKLQLLAERGTPVGPEELIERVERELAGPPLVVVGRQRKGRFMTKTDERVTPDAPPARRGLAWALAVFVAVIAVGGLLYLLSGIGDDEAVIDTPAPTTEAPPTTGLVPLDGAGPTNYPDICAIPFECPDFSTALPGDDGVGPLPLGSVDEVPNENRLDFLFELCRPGEECVFDAHFVDPENPKFGIGMWTAGQPFHIRHGFINSSSEPLGEGFNLAVFVSRQFPDESDPPEVTEAGEAGFEMWRVYKFTADYVLRGASDRCGPAFESQTGPETCEWFVHDFPDGLPAGRFSLWAIWEAPCSEWLDLGITASCEDPAEVISKASATVNSPFGDFSPPIYKYESS